MNALHNITAIFRSPEAAALAAQGLQASETAARQAAAQLQQDVARREHQVQAGSATEHASGVGARQLPLEAQGQRRRREHLKETDTHGAEAPQPRHKLDITV